MPSFVVLVVQHIVCWRPDGLSSELLIQMNMLISTFIENIKIPLPSIARQ